jgi:hypothetical protein
MVQGRGAIQGGKRFSGKSDAEEERSREKSDSGGKQRFRGKYF